MSRAWPPRPSPARRSPSRSLHRFLQDEGRRDDDPAAGAERPRVPRRAAQGADRGRGRPAAGRRPWATGRWPAARPGRCSRCSTAPGLRVSELVGLSLGDVDLDARPDPGVRQGQQGADRAGGRARRPGAGGVARAGGPRRSWCPEQLASAGRCRGGVPRCPGRAPHPAGGVGRAAPPRRAGGPGRSAQPARAPPLLRHAHARPRRRHPGGPGAARPRLDQHHAGVHAGVHRAAVGGVPGGAPASPGRRSSLRPCA